MGFETKRFKILSVDDEKINRDILTRLLNNQYNIITVSDGKSAFEKTESENFDLILMDINLGKPPDGIEVTKKLRSSSKYQRIPIIALTAYAMEGDREKFISAGCTDYVSMPFNKDHLCEVIKKYLQGFS